MSTQNNLLREEFLKTEWVRYPSAHNLKVAGRVLDIDKTSLELFTGGKTKSVMIKRVPKKLIRNWVKMESVVIPGDIVGIQKNGLCVLLTPWQSTERFTPPLVEHTAQKLARQADWNRFLEGVNEFFKKKGFLAVSTPTLVNNPGPEPTIDVFKTEYKQGKRTSEKYLITSPELHLKRIVSQSLTPVYEITKVYRNNEHSPKHQTEFCMVEWYRPFSDLDRIVDDVKKLILFLIKHLRLKNTKIQFESVSYQNILQTYYSYSFKPNTSEEELKKWLKEQSVYFAESMNLDDLFTLVNLELVETKINPAKVVFLNQYPPYTAALAKLDEQGWAQRFEVYWKGLELGNAFNELNDPGIQEERLLTDNLKKTANGLDPLPIDTGFLDSLKRGLPPTVGISVGLERLFMALFSETDISQLKWF